MPLFFLVGGASSGKSSLAVQLAVSRGRPVAVVVTAEARDSEMAARIARHRAERPADWEVIEEPLDVAAAVAKAPNGHSVILDCLTLWVSNLIERGLDDEAIRERAVEAVEVAAGRGGLTIAVSNEVGSGIVPMSALARRFRDVHGSVNALWAARAERSALMVAGRMIALTDPAELLDEAGRD
jgi:adenosyl cobinamide kinase/adenosyl cobinamide phosphate guanylyltransferase